MRIVVNPVKGDPYLVEVDDDGNISDLKHSIYITNGFQPSSMNIVFRGKILGDDTTLKQNKLHDMSKIFLAVQKSSKPPKRIKSAPQRSKFFREENLTHDQISELVDSLKKSNPKEQHLFNDVDTIEDLFKLSKNPEANLARQRSIDQVMDMNEMQVGGFQELVQRYYLIENIIEKSQEATDRLTIGKTVIPDAATKPSTEKLPTPYGLEAKLKFLTTLLDNIPKDHPNRFMLETFSLLIGKSLEFQNANEDDGSGKGKKRIFDPFGEPSFFSPPETNDNDEDYDPFAKGTEEPDFTQIFHTKSPKEPRKKKPVRRLPRKRKNPFSDSSSDDSMGVD